MNEYGLDIVFLCLLDERLGVVTIQGLVFPSPRIAREELDCFALPCQCPGDDLGEAAAYRNMETESHFRG